MLVYNLHTILTAPWSCLLAFLFLFPFVCIFWISVYFVRKFVLYCHVLCWIRICSKARQFCECFYSNPLQNMTRNKNFEVILRMSRVGARLHRYMERRVPLATTNKLDLLVPHKTAWKLYDGIGSLWGRFCILPPQKYLNFVLRTTFNMTKPKNKQIIRFLLPVKWRSWKVDETIFALEVLAFFGFALEWFSTQWAGHAITSCATYLL